MELIFIVLVLICAFIGAVVIMIALIALLARVLESIFERD